MTLVKTLVAIEQRDHAIALREALDAWKLCKHERISALIEVLSKRVAKRYPPGGKKVAEKQAAWLELAAKRDPADVEHLLATLQEVGKRLELEARLTALENELDPRIAAAMCRLLEHPPIPGSTGINLVRQALRIVVAIGDWRSGAALRHIREVNKTGGGMATVALREELPRAYSSFEGLWEPQLSPEAANILQIIEGELARDVEARPTRDPAELFAAVYARPVDDQPRSVLADLLQEQNDPRGEFISLQLARGREGKRTRREASLFKAHARKWLGPIEPAIHREGLVFERGFVAKCRPCGRRLAGIATLCTHAEWATVEEIELDQWEQVQPLVEAMPVLRVLSNVERSYELPSHPRVEHISVRFIIQGNADHLLALKLPSLRSFSARWCYLTLPQMQPFLDSPVGMQLRRLSLNVPDPHAWIPFLAKRKLELGAVCETMNPWQLRFESDRITATYINPGGHAHPQAGEELSQVLESVPSQQDWHVTIVAGHQGSREITGSTVLATSLNRFASHVIEPVE